MAKYLESVLTGLFANGIRDLIKIIIGVIFGWFGHKYYNKNIKIKKSKIKKSFEGKNRDINVSDSEITDSFKKKF